MPLTKGVKLTVEGDCNDYVGKGLSIIIVVYPSIKSSLVSNKIQLSETLFCMALFR